MCCLTSDGFFMFIHIVRVVTSCLIIISIVPIIDYANIILVIIRNVMCIRYWIFEYNTSFVWWLRLNTNGYKGIWSNNFCCCRNRFYRWNWRHKCVFASNPKNYVVLVNLTLRYVYEVKSEFKCNYFLTKNILSFISGTILTAI